MKLIAKMASALGLILTVGPSVVVFRGAMDLDTAKIFMIIGTVIWFASAPVWMNRAAAAGEH
jgi:hypothetical protein